MSGIAIFLSCSTAKVKDYVKLEFVSTTESHPCSFGNVEAGVTPDSYAGVEIYTDSALQ